MEGKYPVAYLGQAVGTVEVKREGLYLHIVCLCEARKEEMLRLYAGEEKLGLLMPFRGGLVLDTRVPAKRLAECIFTLRGKENFIPIRAGEAFYGLQQLKNTVLVFRDGQMGIVNGKSQEISN